MRLLLDTHALLWMLNEPDRLSARAEREILDRDNELFLSIASLWEVTIKVNSGKLTIPGGDIDALLVATRAMKVEVLSIQISHLRALRTLPLHHRDPFDRLLIAQAQAENLTLLTRDARLGSYGIPLAW